MNGGRKKLTKLWAVLCQAMVQTDLKFFQTAKEVVTTLMRDERKGKLLLRFRSCNEKLQVRSGTLGLLTCDGGTLGIMAATDQAISSFANNSWAEGALIKGKLGSEDRIDGSAQMHLDSDIAKSSVPKSANDEACVQKLIYRIKGSIEVICSDSAADEVAATKAGKIAVSRDKAHGAKRTMFVCMAWIMHDVSEVSCSLFSLRPWRHVCFVCLITCDLRKDSQWTMEC